MVKQVFRVTDMHCTNCVMRLEGLEDDPRALGRMMRKMSKEMGEDAGPEFARIPFSAAICDQPLLHPLDLGLLRGDLGAELIQRWTQRQQLRLGQSPSVVER